MSTSSTSLCKSVRFRYITVQNITRASASAYAPMPYKKHSLLDGPTPARLVETPPRGGGGGLIRPLGPPAHASSENATGTDAEVGRRQGIRRQASSGPASDRQHVLLVARRLHCGGDRRRHHVPGHGAGHAAAEGAERAVVGPRAEGPNRGTIGAEAEHGREAAQAARAEARAARVVVRGRLVAVLAPPIPALLVLGRVLCISGCGRILWTWTDHLLTFA